MHSMQQRGVCKLRRINQTPRKGQRNEMKTYTVRYIPPDQYKALRIKAAENETSINKTILKAIAQYLKGTKQCKK